MTPQTTPTLEVTKIDVEEGFNARTSQSADGLERLSASIATEGMIAPLLVKATDDGPLDNTQVYKVPPGYVFAMGDNRDDSLDSRVLNAVGYVPVENLVGRAEFIFLSIGGSAPLWEVWEWPFEIRWNRLFTGIT